MCIPLCVPQVLNSLVDELKLGTFIVWLIISWLRIDTTDSAHGSPRLTKIVGITACVFVRVPFYLRHSI